MASLMLLTAAGCKGNTPGVSSSPSVSSSAAAGASEASSGTSSASPSSSTAGQQASSGVSRGTSSTPKSTYKIDTTTYKFNKGSKNFRVEYPQLSGNGNYSGVNAALKQTAMKTADSIGTGNPSSFAEVRVSSHVASFSSDFLSVEFQESSRTSKTADKTQAFRTVNYDLKNSKALSTDDLIQKNGALTTAVRNAVKKQMSPKKQQLYTDSVISSGLNGCSVYFKDDGFGISLAVSASLGGHEELRIDYQDTSGFRTGNAAWSYFAKK